MVGPSWWDIPADPPNPPDLSQLIQLATTHHPPPTWCRMGQLGELVESLVLVGRTGWVMNGWDVVH